MIIKKHTIFKILLFVCLFLIISPCSYIKLLGFYRTLFWTFHFEVFILDPLNLLKPGGMLS